jgi:hypothetical protein
MLKTILSSPIMLAEPNVFFSPLNPPRGKFQAYKIIKIVNSEYLETLDAQAPFTFWGKGWGRGLPRGKF